MHPTALGLLQDRNRRAISRLGPSGSCLRVGGAELRARAVFWEELYNTVDVILRQAEVALWLLTFSAV